MPQIGVVIPAWNAEEFLAEAIESVQGQTFGNWRLVVVDNGSTDGTAALAHRYATFDDRITVISQANAGPSGARNTGVAALPSEADYCLFLDSDDMLEPQALELLFPAASRPGVIGAHGLPREIDERGVPAPKQLHEAWGHVRQQARRFRVRALQPEEDTDFASLVIWPCIETPGQVLIKRGALEAAGPWRSMPSEDWDLWLRLATHGSFGYVPRYVVSKRERSDSLSRDGKWMAQAEPAIRRMLASHSLPPEQRHVARMGHLLSCWVKLTWVRDDLRAHRWNSALRNTYRWMKSSVRFAGVAWRY